MEFHYKKTILMTLMYLYKITIACHMMFNSCVELNELYDPIFSMRSMMLTRGAIWMHVS